MQHIAFFHPPFCSCFWILFMQKKILGPCCSDQTLFGFHWTNNQFLHLPTRSLQLRLNTLSWVHTHLYTNTNIPVLLWYNQILWIFNDAQGKLGSVKLALGNVNGFQLLQLSCKDLKPICKGLITQGRFSGEKIQLTMWEFNLLHL